MCATDMYMDRVFESCVYPVTNTRCNHQLDEWSEYIRSSPTFEREYKMPNLTVWDLAPMPKYLFLLHKQVFQSCEQTTNVVGIFVASSVDECTQLLTSHIQSAYSTTLAAQWSYFVSHDIHAINSIPVFNVKSKVCYLEFIRETSCVVQVKVKKQLVYLSSFDRDSFSTFKAELHKADNFVIQVFNDPMQRMKTIMIDTVDNETPASLMHYICSYCDDVCVDDHLHRDEQKEDDFPPIQEFVDRLKRCFLRPKLMADYVPPF